MSSDEGYWIALENAGVRKPVVDETPSQADLWRALNPHLYQDGASGGTSGPSSARPGEWKGGEGRVYTE